MAKTYDVKRLSLKSLCLIKLNYSVIMWVVLQIRSLENVYKLCKALTFILKMKNKNEQVVVWEKRISFIMHSLMISDGILSDIWITP